MIERVINMGLVTDYAISLTHLYGLLTKDKVIEIYNMHHEETLKVDDLYEDIEASMEELQSNFVQSHGDYVVHDTIMEYCDLEEELAKRNGKPFYIPEEEELLKYKDDFYFERNRAYEEMLNYIEKTFYNGDRYEAEGLCDDIQGVCQYGNPPGGVFEHLNDVGIILEDENQVRKIMELVMQLTNNTRLWENNGFTPNELSERGAVNPLSGQAPNNAMASKALISVKKIGRNEPCPCGSGKKYKKCCMNKA